METLLHRAKIIDLLRLNERRLKRITFAQIRSYACNFNGTAVASPLTSIRAEMPLATRSGTFSLRVPSSGIARQKPLTLYLGIVFILETETKMIANITIGRVAKLARVNIQTVRYYERRGILAPDGHRESGYRLYTEEAIRRIRFIKNAQELGFTLDEIGDLLRLRVSHRARCADVRRKAEAKLRQVDEKIATLRSMRHILERLIRTCRKHGTTDACPILGSLEGEKR